MAAPQQLMLAGGVVLLLVDSTFNNVGSGANFTINRDGTVSSTAAIDIPAVPYDWIAPKSATVGDAWEVLVHKNSGGVLTGTVDTWLALSSNRTWSGPNGVGDIFVNVSIGKLGTSIALITKQFQLTWS